MYLLLIAAAFLFSGCGAAPPTVDIKEDVYGILELNPGNFKTAVKNNLLIAVIFDYADNERASVYTAAAETLKAKSPAIKLANMNLWTHIASSLHVTTPTIYFYKNGKPHKYMHVGQSTADEIVDFIENAPSPEINMNRKWCGCFG